MHGCGCMQAPLVCGFLSKKLAFGRTCTFAGGDKAHQAVWCAEVQAGTLSLHVCENVHFCTAFYHPHFAATPSHTHPNNPQVAIEFDESFAPTVMCHPDTYLNKVVVGAADGRLQLWNIATATKLHTFDGWWVAGVYGSPRGDIGSAYPGAVSLGLVVA